MVANGVIAHHVVTDVLNSGRLHSDLCCTGGVCILVVVPGRLIVVATLVILDVLLAVSSGIIDSFISTDVARVVNCVILPYILIIATAAFRRSSEAATPTEQR